MGIFSGLKKMFSKDICPKDSDLLDLVFPYKSKGHQIYIQSKVTVPENHCFVLGKNGKVLDCFHEGIFELTPANLPKCCNKLRINKQGKNGEFKKSFKAEGYFVNKGEYSFNLETYDKAELGNRASGIFSCGLCADIKFKVNDCTKFMEVLLNEYDYIKQGEAEKILKYLTSEMIVGILNKYNFALSELISQNPIIEQNLFTELGHRYSKIGLILIEITNVKYILPKKYQKEYEKKLNLAKGKEETKQEQKEECLEKEQDEYVPFGSIKFEDENYIIEPKKVLENPPLENVDESKKEPEELNLNNANQEVQEDGSNKIEQEDNTIDNSLNNNIDTQEAKENETNDYVDLDLNNIYKEEKTTNSGIKCLHCGYINEPNAIYCEICENKLK